MADSSAVRAWTFWHTAGVAFAVCVFSADTTSRLHGGPPLPFAAITIVFVLVLIAVVVAWPRDAAPPRAGTGGVIPAVVAAAGAALLAAGLWRWLNLVWWNPLDSLRADMLVIIRQAIHGFLRGRDPYAVYQVPWDAPLAYGPVLWSPYVIPSMLGVELRYVTVIGEMFVPACCALAALVEARRRQALGAAAWLLLLTAIVFNPDLWNFTSIGHTPSYWPWLPLFALLVVAEQWSAAACVLGLLVVGRTTMVSIVPVFVMALWLRARSRMARAIGIMLATIAALLVPFLVWDPQALWYGMVAVYSPVIKTVIWTTPDIVRTIGVTGWLISHQLHRFVEVTQVAVMAGGYMLAWRALRRGAALLPWCVITLLAFSLTTLWPVYYIYFDVLWLLVSAAFAVTLGRVPPRQPITGWLALLGSVSALVAVVATIAVPRFPTLDFATEAGRRALYKGWLVSRLEGAEPAALIHGREATIAIPRRSKSAASIVLLAEGVVAEGSAPQVVSALLNGTPIGTVPADRGWQELRFHAPRELWIAGSNELKLYCASTVPPVSVGLGPDARHVALGVRRVAVVAEDDGPR